MQWAGGVYIPACNGQGVCVSQRAMGVSASGSRGHAPRLSGTSAFCHKHAYFYRLIMLAQSIQLSCVISHLDVLKYKPEALCSISSVIKLYC